MQDRQIDLEAAEWLVRLDDVERRADGEEQRDWIAWLRRSPQHVQAYFDIATLSQSIGEVPPEGQRRIRALLDAHRADNASLEGLRFLREDNRPRFGGGRLWIAAAASVACIVATAVWFVSVRDRYDTGVGQQIAYQLPDGSSMVLNTRSRARVSMDGKERIVELDGEALFTVAREAGRPFLVRTRNAITRAVGTQFNVYEQADGATRVSVVEGAVQVSPASPTPHADPMLLSAGQEAEVRPTGIARRTTANVAASVAWRKKVLVFEDAPLREVAAQFNRYNVMQFSIAPQIDDGHRLSGTFDPLHPEYFQAYLEKDSSLTVEMRNDVVRVTVR